MGLPAYKEGDSQALGL